MAVTHLGRSLLYGGLVFGAFACDALAKLSHDHVWFGGSLFAAPVLLDSCLRWYGLRSRERRDARVVQMIEQQQAAMLAITTSLSAEQNLVASIVSLQALNNATRDLAELLAAPGLAETPNNIRSD
jgi:hypothetical protein